MKCHYIKHGINGKQLSFYDIRIAKVVLRSFIHTLFIIFHCLYIDDELWLNKDYGHVKNFRGLHGDSNPCPLRRCMCNDLPGQLVGLTVFICWARVLAVVMSSNRVETTCIFQLSETIA